MFTEEQLKKISQKLHSLSKITVFPEEAEAVDFLDKTLTIQEMEHTIYRETQFDGRSGGLLDFSNNELPVIIVPDLHGRSDFLVNLLDSDILDKIYGEEKSVLEYLNEEKVIIVCVGDCVHGEARVVERWNRSYAEWMGGIYAGPNMQEEMMENLSTVSVVMELKNTFTSGFHILKGNHENIRNETGNGNFSFRKFAMEGQMCLDFVQQVFGDVVLHYVDLWEKSLPVCALFKNFGVSHAEPVRPFLRRQIVNYSLNPDVISGLTWTRNDEAEPDSCRKLFKSLAERESSAKSLWFGGHRPIFTEENYALRQNGDYVQIHNPDMENVAVVKSNGDFEVVSLN